MPSDEQADHRRTRRFRATCRAIVYALGAPVLMAVFLPVAAHALVATTSLSPASGPPGTSVTVTGSGFPAGVVGSIKMRPAGVASVMTTKRGRFTAAFSVPATLSGQQSVVTSAGGLTASSPFAIAPSTLPSGSVGRSGAQLTLNGAPYRFTGLNAYHLSTDYSINYGCGENNTAAQVDALFASLRPNSMIRFWAFQQLAWNKNTGSLDFTTIDRIVSSAERNGQKLIVTLGNQWGPGCGETRKTEWWYGGGYRQVVTNKEPPRNNIVVVTAWRCAGAWAGPCSSSPRGSRGDRAGRRPVPPS